MTRTASSNPVQPRPTHHRTNPTATSSPRPSPYGGDEVAGRPETSPPAHTSSSTSSTHLALEPLAAHAGITLGQIGTHRPGDPLTGLTALATRLGTSVSTLKRARTNGLTTLQADTWAIQLGALPQDIWGPDWWPTPGDEPLTGTAALNDTKTQCPAGHPYDRTDNRGHRCCSTCQAEANRRSRARHSWRTAA